MEEVNRLTTNDFPDTKFVPINSYDMEEVLVSSEDNFLVLVEEHNKMVDVVNQLVRERNESIRINKKRT